jgi:diphthamide biosynthesis protein 2
MQRYYLVQKAKDADVIGIVAGTLGVAQYLEAIDYIKKMIRNAGKKFYMFVVGKLNVAKLANFQEIDIFVMVACPENTLVDSKEFFKPIVTPFELEVALVRYTVYKLQLMIYSEERNGQVNTLQISVKFFLVCKISLEIWKILH